MKELMFAKVIDEVAVIQNLFAHQVNNDDLELWQPPCYDTFPLIELINRSDDPHALSIPLGQNIDLTGKHPAFALAGGGFFHYEDNVVQYQSKSRELNK